MMKSFISNLQKKHPQKRLKDPVCGMEITDDISFVHNGETHFFCSNYCRQQFEKEPDRYVGK